MNKYLHTFTSVGFFIHIKYCYFTLLDDTTTNYVVTWIYIPRGLDLENSVSIVVSGSYICYCLFLSSPTRMRV